MIEIGIGFDGPEGTRDWEERRRGKYIVIEGIDGAGKTTQVERLKDWLSARDIKSEVVREPGGDPFAEKMREVILDDSYPVTALAQHFAFQAQRANMRANVVRPLLDDGVWVLSDRSEASTLVYQSFAGGLDEKVVWPDIVVVQQIACPDVYLMLDITAETQAIRRPVLDDGRFERADVAYREKLFRGYHWVVDYLQSRGAQAHRIDGNGDTASVFSAITNRVGAMM